MGARRKVHVEVEIDPTSRDYAMARLAAARVSAQSAINAIDEALELFIEVEDDEKGKDRKELVATALECIGCASRALECAEEIMPQVDPEECEPWDGDDEDDAPAELPRATARERRA